MRALRLKIVEDWSFEALIEPIILVDHMQMRGFHRLELARRVLRASASSAFEVARVLEDEPFAKRAPLLEVQGRWKSEILSIFGYQFFLGRSSFLLKVRHKLAPRLPLIGGCTLRALNAEIAFSKLDGVIRTLALSASCMNGKWETCLLLRLSKSPVFYSGRAIDIPASYSSVFLGPFVESETVGWP